jgi:hypothetical protein
MVPGSAAPWCGANPTPLQGTFVEGSGKRLSLFSWSCSRTAANFASFRRSWVPSWGLLEQARRRHGNTVAPCKTQFSLAKAAPVPGLAGFEFQAAAQRRGAGCKVEMPGADNAFKGTGPNGTQLQPRASNAPRSTDKEFFRMAMRTPTRPWRPGASPSANTPCARQMREPLSGIGVAPTVTVRESSRHALRRHRRRRSGLLGGEGGIRTHVPGRPDHLISSQRRYDRFGTSPASADSSIGQRH